VILPTAGGVFQYFIKVVPTIYSDISSDVSSYQFSYTHQTRYMDPFGQMSALPGAFFVFDMSPFMVKVENDRMPLTHFLTKICAIVGGVVSVRLACRVTNREDASLTLSSLLSQIAGFVDSFMYNSLNVRKLSNTVGGGAGKVGGASKFG
jgi:hypothetical protein